MTPAVASDAVKSEGAQPRILVVDDEPSMREMLKIVLKREGYEVLVARSGTEAIEMLKRDLAGEG